MKDSDFAGLAERLSSLERANRRWRLGSLLLFVLLAATVFLSGPLSFARHSATKASSKAVVAREFILQDAAGNVRGRMAIMDGQPVLQFYDATGRLAWSAPPKGGVFLLTTKPH